MPKRTYRARSVKSVDAQTLDDVPSLHDGKAAVLIARLHEEPTVLSSGPPGLGRGQVFWNKD